MPTVTIKITHFDQHELEVDGTQVARGEGDYQGDFDLSVGEHNVDWQGTGNGSYTVTFDGATPKSVTGRFVNGVADRGCKITVPDAAPAAVASVKGRST